MLLITEQAPSLLSLENGFAVGSVYTSPDAGSPLASAQPLILLHYKQGMTHFKNLYPLEGNKIKFN